RRRLDAAPALRDVVAQRLLDVYVLACLARPDRDERVPVVGRRDRDHVEFLVLQSLANVLNAFRLVAALVSDLFAPRLEQAAVRVDQVRDLDVLYAEVLIDVAVPLPVDAGDADADHVVGAEHPPGRLGAGVGEKRKHRAGRGRSLEETASRDSLHERLLIAVWKASEAGLGANSVLLAAGIRSARKNRRIW